MLQVLLFVCMLAAGNLLWKYGLVQMNGFMTNDKTLWQGIRDLLKSWPIWAGGVFYVVGTLYWFTILSRENISYVYPMVSIGYVITAVSGALIFGETILTTGWIGMGIVLLGFLVLSIR